MSPNISSNFLFDSFKERKYNKSSNTSSDFLIDIFKDFISTMIGEIVDLVECNDNGLVFPQRAKDLIAELAGTARKQSLYKGFINGETAKISFLEEEKMLYKDTLSVDEVYMYMMFKIVMSYNFTKKLTYITLFMPIIDDLLNNRKAPLIEI